MTSFPIIKTMLPTIDPPRSPPAPEHGPLIRAARAFIVERRLPYAVQVRWDRIAKWVGKRTKRVCVHGLQICVRRQTCDELFVENILNVQEYTSAGFDIPQSGTVIDIGGNIGTFALLASRAVGPCGHVITIEPEVENFKLLRKNLELNRAANVVALQAAVGASEGERDLACSEEGGYHSLVYGSNGFVSERVRVIRLQDVFDTYNIGLCDFLKIDCEGAEYEILFNLPPRYFARIGKIAMEWHSGSELAEVRRQESGRLVHHLICQGFKINTYTEHLGFKCGAIRAARC